MFGRRNADALPVQRPVESDVSLDDLPDLPDILATPLAPAAPAQENPPAPAERTPLLRPTSAPSPTEQPVSVASSSPQLGMPAQVVSPAAGSASPSPSTAPSAGLGSLAGLTGSAPQPSGLLGSTITTAPTPTMPVGAMPPVASPASTVPGALVPEPRTTESVIGPDDFFDGTYRSERGVRIQGTAHGSIESRQSIVVEAGAHVEASLSAEEITVAGVCSGTIECRGRLEITGSGRVKGQVTTARLVIREGGVLDGQIQMRSEGEKGL